MKHILRVSAFILIFVIITIVVFINTADRITYRDYSEIDNADNIIIEVENPEVMEVMGYKYIPSLGRIDVDLRALSEGESRIDVIVPGEGVVASDSFSVHKFNIIVEKENLGSITNIFFYRIEIFLVLLSVFVLTLLKAKKIGRENRYSYSLMYCMGICIFTSISTIIWFDSTIHSKTSNLDSLSTLYYEVMNIVGTFSTVAIPIMLLFSIFLIASNIVLIKKEGAFVINTLGFIVGFLIIVASFLEIFVFYIIDSMVDVHSYAGIHVEFFIEISITTLLSYFECMLLGTLFSTIMAARHIPGYDKDYMIILGCGLRSDGTPTPLLSDRIDRAIWFANRQKDKSGKDIKFVASGGQGEDEIISEAESIRNYLTENGVSEDHILLEDKSTSTYENMKYSKQVIEKDCDNAKIAFSTAGYHVFRSGNIANTVGIKASGVGCKTKWYFTINALIREFIANISVERKRHIINVISMELILLTMIIVSYAFHIL